MNTSAPRFCCGIALFGVNMQFSHNSCYKDCVKIAQEHLFVIDILVQNFCFGLTIVASIFSTKFSKYLGIRSADTARAIRVPAITAVL